MRAHESREKPRAVNARPIIFSGPMVRAILEGRKTVTRRLQRTKIGVPAFGLGAGDRLWVKETWHPSGRMGLDVMVEYQADMSERERRWTGDGDIDRSIACSHWRSSLFMPRWASRITLEVVSVRAERLHAIDDEDAKREGLSSNSKDGGVTYKYGIPDRDGWPGTDDDGMPWSDWSTSPRKAFSKLWDKINGKRAPWASNPWVWRVEFRMVA